MPGFALKARIAQRPDSEFNQATIRLAIGVVVTVGVLFFSGYFRPELINALNWFGPTFIVVSLGIMAASLVDLRISHPRRIFGMLIDFWAASYLLAHGGMNASLMVIVCLWVTLGNGFRYGLPYLYGAMALGLLGFFVADLLNPEFGTIHGVRFLVYGLLTAIPLYCGYLIKRLHGALAAAQEANLSQSRFLSVMSHEIRTPLNGVIGMVKLAMDGPMSNKQRGQLHRAETAAQFLLKLLNEILDFTRLGADSVELRPSTFRVDDTLESVATMFQAKAWEKRIRLHLDLHPDLPRAVTGDAFRLVQVLNNLVGNAVKFTEKGEIVLSAAPSGPDRIEFKVFDTGPGIPQDMLKDIFRPFIQADNETSRRHGGTGLGLAICERIVQLMGGQMGVSSEVGRGTTMHFTLPLTSQEPVAGIAVSQGRHVLILQSDATAAAIIERWLRSAGHHTDRVTTSQDALDALARSKAHDLVLVDEIGMDVALLDFARQAHAHRDLPIILLRAPGHDSVSEDDAFGLIQAMVDSPITPRNLLGAIDEHQDSTPVVYGEDVFEITRYVHGAQILLVEDVIENQMVARGYLDKMGMLCDTADTGEAAIHAIESKDYDLVLMDIQMPGMDGFEAASQILAVHDVPIIALTAAALEHDKERVKAAGMVDHLPKPIQEVDLAHALVKWIRRGGTMVKKPRKEGLTA